MKKTVAMIALFSSAMISANEPVWDANKVNMVSEKLADGVFAYYSEEAKAKQSKGLPVATSGGFVVGSKGVVMIDTMLNKRLNEQVKDLIKKETKQPISYAVNTSYHGDHSYGNMYLPKTSKIIQHEKTQNYIQTHFEGDTKFMMQNFGKGRGIEEIKPMPADLLIPEGGKLTLDLGDRTLEVIDFGFAQTGGDLFVWEPKSKVMWAGNPIITVKPALPWLLDGHLQDTLTTLQKVYDFLPNGSRIVPGHGAVIKKDDIKWHIDYLTAVRDQVKAAVKEGLSLKETVAKVKLPEFEGYALYGWVHNGLNVPAAYKELKK